MATVDIRNVRKSFGNFEVLHGVSVDISDGEFVVLVKGAETAQDEAIPADAKRILQVLLEDLSLKQAASLASRLTGVKKNLLYALALDSASKADDQPAH